MTSSQAVRSAVGMLMVVLALAFASPCLAQVAAIEATAPLPDYSERSIMRAMLEAVETAVQRALTLGFSWAALSRTLVLEDRVTVQILATDADPDGEGEAEAAPGGAPGPGPHPAAKLLI